MQPPVELDGIEDIGGLRAAVGEPAVVGCSREARIVEIDIRVAMSVRRDTDDAPTVVQEAQEPVDEDEVPEVVGAELRLEAILGSPLRRGHHAGIRDHDVEPLSLRMQAVRRGTHGAEGREVDLEQFERPGDASGSRLRLREIARGADDVRPVRGESPRGLDAIPDETPVTSTRLPSSFTPASTSSVVDCAPNSFLDIDVSPFWRAT